ncbi:MAG: DEAD/DEAH box helicase family protein [Coleofasciculaceae cyanobacterium SM2_3_26]|nr:DEAD/DEAH box helicase family protein [Coleofasciculaceae cyanobacterium SM2_3_26]
MTPSFSVQSALAPSAPLKSATLPRLRDYQVKVKQQLYEEIRKGHQRILVVAATGAGKTVISAAIVYDMASIRGKRVLLVVHRDVLITQTQEKLANFGIEAGVIAGNYRENRIARVQVASVQTLSRRGLDWFQPDVVFWDEAHLSAFSGVAHQMMPRLREGKRCQWQDLLPDLQQLGLTLPVTFAQVKHAYKQLTGHGIDRPLEDKQAIDRAWENLKAQKPLIDGTYNPDDNTIHIGLTATPWRLSRREEMGDIFETLVCAPMPWQLMDMGYLVKPVYYSLPEADLQGVRTQAGDFAIKDLEPVATMRA